jgi:hypothetical protein
LGWIAKDGGIQVELLAAEKLFFIKRPQAESVYFVLREKLLNMPGVTASVFKTQISFGARRVFACVSHPPVKRLGEKAVLVSFHIPWQLDSPRLFARAEPKPGRFTCHVAVTEESQVDAELLGWIEEAYQFACRP